jgi:hypothetical protein
MTNNFLPRTLAWNFDENCKSDTSASIIFIIIIGGTCHIIIDSDVAL